MPDDQGKLSIAEFAGKIKASLPQFAAADDAELTRKFLEKRPDLINQIQTSVPRPASTKSDPDSYLSQGVQALKSVGTALTTGMYEQSKVRPTDGTPPEMVGVPMPGAFVKNTVDDVLDGLQKGYQARQEARKQGEGIPGQILATAEQYPVVGPLVQKVEQSLSPADLESAKSGPVLPPGAFGAVVEGTGYAAAPDVLKKAGGAIVKGAGAVLDKGPAALQKGAQSILGVGPKLTEKAVAGANDVIGENATKAADVASDNAAKAGDVAKREQMEGQVQQNATKLGEGIKDLEKKVRETEVNPRYEAVRKAVSQDPGVPMADLAKDAVHAEQNILKGSKESIKQFRELIRGAPESEGIETSAGFTKPGEPLYDQLASEGAIDQGGNLPFDQLQGYYSELGTKLSSGNLPGDVYQAMKYLQGKIGDAMKKVADRNGAGPQLQEAQSYYKGFMDTFHNTDAISKSGSPVAHAMRASDPGFYEAPFTGKGGARGITMLRNYSPGLADLADQVRQGRSDVNALPKKAVMKVAAQKELPELDPATLKADAISQTADRVGKFNHFDATVLASSVIASFLGRWENVLFGPAELALKKGAGAALDNPSVVKWLSKPQEGDLNALKKLPPDVQNEVRKNMTNYITKQQASGTPFTVSPAVSRFLAGSAAESKKPTDLKAEGASLAQ